MNKPAAAAAAHLTNFIRNAIDADLAAGKYASRTWGGRPGLAAAHAGAPPDPAKIRTRFPPEPNGYLHFGHAKSICLNFGLARDYGGVCHMRFDDTNPEKEEQEYVDSILDAVRWLGFGWSANGTEHLYYASDYFDAMYQAAEYLVTLGPRLRRRAERRGAARHARHAHRARPGQPLARPPGGRVARAPARNARRQARRRQHGAARENRHDLAQHQPARPGDLPHQARARITAPATNGASIRCTPTPTRSRTRWSSITHSICTLEFEDQRPFYDWLLERLAEGGLLARPLPQQIEFARLNLTYVVLSKRKLIQLVERRTCRRLGRSAHADAGRRRAGAAIRPRASACSPSASAYPSPTPGSTTACSRNACAST